MKGKVFTLLIAGIFALSMTGLAFAQAKPAAPPKPEAKKPEPPKPVVYRLGGQVTAIDVAGKKITVAQQAVKQQKKVTLKVSKKAAQDLAGINVGDVVNVWVTDKTVTALKKIY